MRYYLVLVVAVVACARFGQAAKCSDHLLSLKADDWSEADGGKYGLKFIIDWIMFFFNLWF